MSRWDTLYVYHVDVPESMVRTPTEAPQTCTARERDPVRIPIDTTAVKGKDTVWITVVRMDGTTRVPIKPPSDIDAYAGSRRRTLTTSMDSVAVTTDPRKLSGQRLTVQEPNTGRVLCSVALGAPSAATRPVGRPLPAPEAVVSIGASFDLLDGVRASDLYTDARVFAPGVGPRHLERWGVQAGIYQGRITAKGSLSGDTMPRRFSHISPAVPLDTVGGLLVRRRTYERTESRRENTLGLYAGLNYSITPDLYIIPFQFEVRREHLLHTVRDTVLQDTLLRLPRGESIRSSEPPGRRTISGISYRPAFMTGARLDLRRETFNLVLQPLVGARRIQVCDVPTSGEPFVCESKWGLGEWDVTFELEASKSGVKLGGEVRGFQSQEPSILVYLAKEFTIDKFAEFLTGPKR